MPSFLAWSRRGVAWTLLLLAGVPAPAAALAIASTHPRLFVRADSALVGAGPTVSELRARRTEPEIAPYARLASSDANWEGILTPALQTLLGGDAAAQSQVRAWLLDQTEPSKHSTGRQGAGHMAVAFDWVYGSLSPAERRQVAENIRTGTDAAVAFLHVGRPDINHNFTYMALFSVAMAGLALHDEPGYEAVARAYLDEARDWLEGPGGAYEAAAARGGTWPEGSQYSLTECTRLLVLTMHGYRSATDVDPFVLARTRYGDFLRGTARFAMALARPDLTLERLGDMNQFKPLLRDQHRFVFEALAAGLRTDGGDARVPGMLEHFSDLVHASYGMRDTHRNFGWGMVVFDDPSAPRDAASYETQPLLQVFGRGTLDLVVMRHGWDESGVSITFAAGDHFADHQHFDKGAFTIYHRGALAIDSGTYDRMYGAHHSQYATRTVAHNAPLVFDPQQPLAPDYKPDGGQRVLRGFQHHARWSDYLAHREPEHLDAADLESADSGMAPRLEVASASESPAATPADAHASSAAAFTQWAVARAQLAGAYGPAVRSLRRTLAYWPSAQIVVVDDAFELASPLDVAFTLHTVDAPLASGNGQATPGDATLGAIDWWVMTRRGSLDLGEREVVYDGRLFLRTLVPRAHRDRRIGGKGFEWWVNGVNYKPASNAGEPREPGAWRVEVHPENASAHPHATHAMLVTDPSVVRMPDCEATSVSNGWHGAHVASAPEVFLGIADAARGPLPLRYQLTTALPCVHVLVGLEPGAAVDVQSGTSARRLRASAEGVVAFHDPEVGPHAVAVTSAGAP
jgi:hypothetical protein